MTEQEQRLQRIERMYLQLQHDVNSLAKMSNVMDVKKAKAELEQIALNPDTPFIVRTKIEHWMLRHLR